MADIALLALGIGAFALFALIAQFLWRV